MGLILDLSPRTLEKVLYFASYIVLDPGKTDLAVQAGPDRKGVSGGKGKMGQCISGSAMGAESIQELLKAIDLEKESEELKSRSEGRHRSEACQNHQASGSRRGIPRVR